MASLGPKTDAPPASIRQRTMTRDDDRGMSAQGEISSQRSEGETVAMVQPSATGAQGPPSSKAVRVPDPEEIKLLMKQGEQLIAAGDVVTARVVFQRAADAGNANAAMALGATYDPNVLGKLGVVGLSADVEQARSWYRKAENLGSPDARGRLDGLPDH
jgi:TPR repeat protein